jgi:hypothetical protein
MRRSLFAPVLILVACGGAPAVDAPSIEPLAEVPVTVVPVEGGVRLELSLDPDRPRHHFCWKGAQLRLINEGPDTVTVVAPGDGSNLGFRTPTIEWIVTTEDNCVIRKRSIGCGTINPLKEEEIVVLEPGGEVAFDEWIGIPKLSKGDVHFIAVRYTNDPGILDQEFPLMTGPSPLLDKVRTSTPLSLTSNTIRYERP